MTISRPLTYLDTGEIFGPGDGDEEFSQSPIAALNDPDEELGHLLAAAPDLLAVAVAVLAVIDPACTVERVYGERGDGLNERAADLYRAAEAAIARASPQ